MKTYHVVIAYEGKAWFRAYTKDLNDVPVMVWDYCKRHFKPPLSPEKILDMCFGKCAPKEKRDGCVRVTEIDETLCPRYKELFPPTAMPRRKATKESIVQKPKTDADYL